MEHALEAADELVVDALEPRALLFGCAGVGEEVALVATPATDGQFVAGQADLAPVFLPRAFPRIGRGKAGEFGFAMGLFLIRS